MRTVVLVVAAALAVALAVAAGCTKKIAPALADAGVVAALPAGTRQIERLQYNDVTDMWRLFLVGRANLKEPERVEFLRIAHLSDAELAKGTKPYVKADAGGPIAYLGAGFNVGLLHGFVEQRADAATGKNVNVVTRTEKRWWDPFGGKKLIDGADPYADGQFLYPPPADGDAVVVGVGGHGPTKEAAAASFRAQFGAMPQAVKLKNEGFSNAVDNPAAKKEAAAIVHVPVDPITALDNKVIGKAPGSAVDHSKKTAKKKKPR